MPTLVLSNRASVDRDAIVAAAAKSKLCDTVVMSGWRVPAELRGRSDIRLYAESLFCEATAGDLGVALLDAAPDWLARCPIDLLQRNVTVTTLGNARRGTFPAFIKSCDDKLGGVTAGVRDSADALPDAPPETMVVISEPVQFDVEIRLFCASSKVLTGSTYWRHGEPWQCALEDFELADQAVAFAHAVLAEGSDGLPPAHVLDVGLLDTGRWAVIEANGAWGSGLYASDPTQALECILRSTISSSQSHGLASELVRSPPPAEW